MYNTNPLSNYYNPDLYNCGYKCLFIFNILNIIFKRLDLEPLFIFLSWVRNKKLIKNIKVYFLYMYKALKQKNIAKLHAAQISAAIK